MEPPRSRGGVRVHIVCNVDCDGVVSRGAGDLPKEFIDSGQWDYTKSLVSKGVIVMDAATAMHLAEQERPSARLALVLFHDPQRLCLGYNENAVVALTPDEVLDWCMRNGRDDVYVIGGSDAHLAFLPRASDIQVHILRCAIAIDEPSTCQRSPLWGALRWGRRSFFVAKDVEVPVTHKHFLLPSNTQEPESSAVGGAFDKEAALEATLKEARQKLDEEQRHGHGSGGGGWTKEENEDDDVVLKLALEVSAEHFENEERAKREHLENEERAKQEQAAIMANYKAALSRGMGNNAANEDDDEWADSDYDLDDFGDGEEEGGEDHED
ncbi:hypothetical protein [Mollivirus kamchatka]|nr:hypothetical protein [Mollivirus kamchatka]